MGKKRIASLKIPKDSDKRMFEVALRDCLILHAEFDHTGCISYVIQHDDLRGIDVGEIVPEVAVTIRTNRDGSMERLYFSERKDRYIVMMYNDIPYAIPAKFKDDQTIEIIEKYGIEMNYDFEFEYTKPIDRSFIKD